MIPVTAFSPRKLLVLLASAVLVALASPVWA